MTPGDSQMGGHVPQSCQGGDQTIGYLTGNTVDFCHGQAETWLSTGQGVETLPVIPDPPLICSMTRGRSFTAVLLECILSTERY